MLQIFIRPVVQVGCLWLAVYLAVGTQFSFEHGEKFVRRSSKLVLRLYSLICICRNLAPLFLPKSREELTLSVGDRLMISHLIYLPCGGGRPGEKIRFDDDFGFASTLLRS